MDKRDFIKRLYAGIFFIIGLGLIMVVILAIGMEKGLTQPKFQVTVLFREVGGLSEGAPVRLSGVTIGTVAHIDFLKEHIRGRSVKVILNIFQRYKEQFAQGTRFAIKTEGVLGEKLVEISIDDVSGRLDLTQPIIGEDPLDVQDLANTFTEAAVSFKDASASIDDVIDELQNISRATRRLMHRVEERLLDGTLFKIF